MADYDYIVIAMSKAENIIATLLRIEIIELKD